MQKLLYASKTGGMPIALILCSMIPLGCGRTPERIDVASWEHEEVLTNGIWKSQSLAYRYPERFSVYSEQDTQIVCVIDRKKRRFMVPVLRFTVHDDMTEQPVPSTETAWRIGVYSESLRCYQVPLDSKDGYRFFDYWAQKQLDQKRVVRIVLRDGQLDAADANRKMRLVCELLEAIKVVTKAPRNPRES